MELASFQEVAEAKGFDSADSVGTRGADVASANELAATKVAEIPNVMAVASRIEFPMPDNQIARYFATPDSHEPPVPTYDEDGCVTYESDMTVFERRERPDDGGNTVVSYQKVAGIGLEFAAQPDGSVEISIDELGSNTPNQLARDGVAGEEAKKALKGFINRLVQTLDGKARGTSMPLGRALDDAAHEKRHDIAMMAPHAYQPELNPSKQGDGPLIVGLQWASEVKI
jgi:hypothetical protein